MNRIEEASNSSQYSKMSKVLFFIMLLGVSLPLTAQFSFITNKLFSFSNELIGETCNSYYLKNDLDGLDWELKTHLFGQPLVRNLVLTVMRHHLDPQHSTRKALVLSFHGFPGTGKNFLADMISRSLFKLGVKSQYRHFYSGRFSFPHDSKISTYKEKLREEISRAVYTCPQSLFIFDEVDKMPQGIFDVVKPYMDYEVSLRDGNDYSKSIFIFLSNTGSKEIVDKCVELERRGVQRDEYSYKDFERILKDESYQEEGGLQRSMIIRHHLIDQYVPFLPLTAEHVSRCILHEARRLGLNWSQLKTQKVLEQLAFWPEPDLLFSTTGCKTLTTKVQITARLKSEL